MRSITPFLFAYGTLQKGYAPPEAMHLLKRLKKIGRGMARGQLFHLGDYPGAIFTDSNASAIVRGTVFRLPASPSQRRELLHQLDLYEEFNPADPQSGLFVRKRIPVTLKNNKRLTCWAYEYNADRSGARPIPSGAYKPSRPRHRRAAVG
jgi:gamma-glutamylcyclotransferase (GGCT)/AIG2-like uncharacterized protein YtfP